MAETRQNSKITKYRRRTSWLNIGTILFGAIFLYMVITVFNYLTATHITSYEVTAGSISGNYRYSALALKSEEIVNADFSGNVEYYARGSSRAGVGMTVCSIREDGVPSQESMAELTAEEYHLLHTTSSSFAKNFSAGTFQEVYNYKADMESTLLRTADPDESGVGTANLSTAPVSGFVSYTIDGMEGLTEADITKELFNRTKYKMTNLRLRSQVKAGEPLYKLVTGEEWYLYLPLSSQMATALGDRSSIRFRFLKDDTTFRAGFSILSTDDGFFGKIRLRNSLVRYVSDRYLDIELLMDSKSGLKIPVSAIADRTFLKIPQEYVIPNTDNSGEISLIRETFRSDGSSSVDTVTATVYDRQDHYYLVARNLFKMGDYVQRVNTTKKHQITEEDLTTIQGVYNVNKGYAIFRQVTVIDQNPEYCIVEPYNPYGLAAHDFIVLDASQVTDSSIVN